jgi:nitroreductase
MTKKAAATEHPIEPALARRWSPYIFSKRPVAQTDLRSLFEAARWAPSSFNEQPWRFLVAVQDDQKAFQRLLETLTPGNQAWAAQAPVLIVTVVQTAFSRNDKPNRTALHDLGLAVANLTFEATARGLVVHQMAGIDLEAARRTASVPDGYEVATAIAVGYRGDPDEAADPAHADRDRKARTRRPLAETVFGADFGHTADWLNEPSPRP